MWVIDASWTERGCTKCWHNAHVVGYSDRLLATAGLNLGSELAGMMWRSSSSVVDFEAGCHPKATIASWHHVTRHLLPGHLPPPPKTTVKYICPWSAPLRGLVAGACVRKMGKCRVPAATTADRTEPAPCSTHTTFSLSRPGSPCPGCCSRPTACRLLGLRPETPATEY